MTSRSEPIYIAPDCPPEVEAHVRATNPGARILGRSMVRKVRVPGPRVDLPGQMELPDTGEDKAGLARLKAAAPLKPAKPQRACDHGLFSDAAAQIDLLDNLPQTHRTEESNMTTQIRIDILHGAASVTDADRDRAETAALSVLNAFEWRSGQPMQIDPAEAYAAYQRHTSDEDYNRSLRETILIAAWEAAEKAADLALTTGWHDPNGASCTIAA